MLPNSTGIAGVGQSMKYRTKLAVIIAGASLLAGCVSAEEHRAAVESSEGERLTVGTVQREIRIGMSLSDVAQVLGSPNIVSTDVSNGEVWIYDRISTTRVSSSSSAGILSLILGGAIIGSGGVLAGAVPSYSESAGASSTQQRTLTVIIKFARDKRVRDFAYHTSRF